MNAVLFVSWSGGCGAALRKDRFYQIVQLNHQSVTAASESDLNMSDTYAAHNVVVCECFDASCRRLPGLAALVVWLGLLSGWLADWLAGWLPVWLGWLAGELAGRAGSGWLE